MNESQVPHAEEKKHGKKSLNYSYIHMLLKIASQFFADKN